MHWWLFRSFGVSVTQAGYRAYFCLLVGGGFSSGPEGATLIDGSPYAPWYVQNTEAW